ncbi:DsrE family protein [Methylonatrum kenyense]|uniref:DsrE family protein n=1 Tax=Methylonatrum kenyense TaxID=455253 RepID=UPI0020C127E9|nr:DsrE family protein [Methylonatrum kenyense]MCK8515843.1 DsrE family protein [Methylonatrum kenyense]
MHLAIASTYGPTDPTRATVPFLHARAAREQGDAVTIMLLHDAVLLAHGDSAQDIRAFGPPPLGAIFEELAADPNVTLLVCKPCHTVRRLEESRLHAGARLATMGDFHRAIRENGATVSNYG